MYRTLEEFTAAVHACNPPYTAQELASIGVAWGVYQAASGQMIPRHTDLDCLILGRWVGPAYAGPGIDQDLKNNFFIMDEQVAGGAIMQITGGQWTVLVNDAWLLGGIHSHTPFYLASPRTPETIYDVANARMTVTARELTGLKSFGYSIRRRNGLGEVAVCVNTGLADVADFRTYRQHIDLHAADERWLAELLAPEHGGPDVVAVV